MNLENASSFYLVYRDERDRPFRNERGIWTDPNYRQHSEQFDSVDAALAAQRTLDALDHVRRVVIIGIVDGVHGSVIQYGLDAGSAVTGEVRPLMRDTAATYGVAWTPAQEAAREQDVTESITAYRAARAQMTDEERAEELFEMRAAFGPGERVVNIFTGEVTQL